MSERSCLHCGTTFTAEKPNDGRRGKYCRRSCYDAARAVHSLKVPHTCPYCGRTFLHWLSQRRRHCSYACYWAAKGEIEDRRFLAKLVATEGGHKVFVGPCHPDGYGRTKHRGVTMFASRKAYIIAYGPLTSDQYVQHTCDFPPCCELTHLELGTIRANLRDRNAKGRYRVYPDHYQLLLPNTLWSVGGSGPRVCVRRFRYDFRRGVMVAYGLPSGRVCQLPRDEFLAEFVRC
jgi:hypothetical protein